MKYGVTIGDYHSYKDWGLYLTALPDITAPEPKTYYVDIPGGNGSLDLTESLQGLAYYDRTLSFSLGGKLGYGEWTQKYSEVLNAIHGKKLKLVFDRDSHYYYTGRVTVGKLTYKTPYIAFFPVEVLVSPFKWENDLTEVVGIFTRDDVQQTEMDITPENVAPASFNTDWRFGTEAIPEGLGAYISWTIKYEYVNRGGGHTIYVSDSDGYNYTATLSTSGEITIDSDTLATNGVNAGRVYRILLSGANNATITGTTYPGFSMELEGGADNTELAVVATEGLTNLYLNGEYMFLEDPIWTDCSELTLKEGSNTLVITGDIYFGTVQVQYRRGWL